MINEMRLLDEGARSLGLMLNDSQLEKFSVLMVELSKWNQKVNLTAIKGFKDIVIKHLLDSLSLAAHINLEGSLLDIGSGAGFPAIPISIIKPGLQIVSVDAVQKKILFQKHIARTLDLDNLTAVHARVESLSVNSEKRFDFIVSRAFSSLKSFAELSLPLLADNGKIVAMKGLDGRKEALDTEGELAGSMMQIVNIIEFTLPVSGDSRSLIVLSRLK